MKYGDEVLIRLDQICNLFEVMTAVFEKRIYEARKNDNSLKALEYMHNRGLLINELLTIRYEQLELLGLRKKLSNSKNPDDFKDALYNYSAYIRTLNSKYEIFEDVDQNKLIL